jgi:flotillin
MTKEKLQFELPVVFTIGPDVNNRGDETAHQTEEDKGDALMKYSMLLADSANKGNEGHEHIENIIKGIIEGETRVLVSAMSK